MGIMQIIIANFLIKQYKIVKICLSNIKVGNFNIGYNFSY